MKTSNGLSIAGFVVSLGSLFLGLWGLTGLVGVALSAVGRSQAFSGFAGFIPPEDFGKIWGLGLTWWDWGDYNSIKGKDGESTAGGCAFREPGQVGAGGAARGNMASEALCASASERTAGRPVTGAADGCRRRGPRRRVKQGGTA